MTPIFLPLTHNALLASYTKNLHFPKHTLFTHISLPLNLQFSFKNVPPLLVHAADPDNSLFKTQVQEYLTQEAVPNTPD